MSPLLKGLRERERLPGLTAGCVNCGYPCDDAFCPACGQKQQVGRLTLRGFAASALALVANLEGGLLHTMRELMLRPGTVIRGYVAGRTVRYSHPVAYFTAGLAVFAVISRALGGTTGAGEGDRLFVLFVIPCIAVAARLSFWRRGWNLAEHLIAVIYLSGHMLWLLAALYLGVPLTGGAAAYAALCIAAGIAYFIWGYSDVFMERRWAAAGSAAVAFVGGVMVWLVAMMGLISALRR